MNSSNEIGALPRVSTVVPENKQDSVNNSTSPPKGFDRLVRELPNYDMLLREADAGALCSMLEKADWEAIGKVYRSAPQKLPYDALKALHSGKIALEQFSTCMFFFSVMKDFPQAEILTQPLFTSDGHLHPQAEAYICQTLEPCGAGKDDPAFLDDAKRATFFELMKNQPKSEQVFFYIKVEKHDATFTEEERKQLTFENKITITGEIYYIGVNVFRQFVQEETRYLMIPSFSMLQQFLHVYARPGSAVTITPVVGLSTTDDMVTNIKTDARDMSLPFPGVDLPKKCRSIACTKRHRFYLP